MILSIPGVNWESLENSNRRKVYKRDGNVVVSQLVDYQYSLQINAKI